VDPVVVVRTPDELLAAVPHMLGFNPRESILVVPVSRGLPMARVDLPRTPQDRDQVTRNLRGHYRRYDRPGVMVALVCVTEDRRNAELASQHLAAGLEKAGVGTQVRLWATDERWVELNTGQAGSRTQDTSTRIAAEAVMAGAARPAATRTSLAESLVGDRESLAELLPAVREAAQNSNPVAERNWALDRLEQFHADGNRLSDPDAARLLVAIESTETRDALWEDMSRDNAAEHSALWTDLTRRAPDQVRTPTASLLAFSNWLEGNGAKAWCALDQIPQGPPYPMAALVATVLQGGSHPDMWERLGATGPETETYTPPVPTHRHERNVPRGPEAPGRYAPPR
jgi:hypothetical protein